MVAANVHLNMKFNLNKYYQDFMEIKYNFMGFLLLVFMYFLFTFLKSQVEDLLSIFVIVKLS